MPDEWDASPVTLTNAGDWATWTITLGSGDAADLNNTTGSSTQFLWMRYAMSAASRVGYFALMINDVVGEGIANNPPDLLASGSGWVSAGRFRGSSGGIGGLGAPEFPITSLEGSPGFSAASFSGAPWVAGANTVRFLWFGRDSDGAAEPIQVDFIAVQTNAGTSIIDDWGNGGNDGTPAGADVKPVTLGAFTGYDDLAQGGQILPGSKNTWLLKGNDATTGTAADSEIEVIKFCPPTATIRVTGAGDPIDGTVGAVVFSSAETASLATLTAGEATFTITTGDDFVFWYAGNDDWTPAAITIDELERIGCGGWHVGYIAMAS